MQESDKIGMISSILCLIHCLILPIIVIIGGWTESHFIDLEILDYIFAVISTFAAYKTLKDLKLKKLRKYFILGWIFFIVGLLSHDTYFEYLMHLGTIILIFAHWNNLQYCNKGECMIHKKH